MMLSGLNTYSRRYFYQLTYKGEPLWWYDPMPHPHIPELQSTHPHHKHIPPDIKRHRVPAPELSFIEPNLPYLIEQVEQTVLTAKNGPSA